MSDDKLNECLRLQCIQERRELFQLRTELRTLKEERDKWELRLDSLGKINNAQLETMERQQAELAALRDVLRPAELLLAIIKRRGWSQQVAPFYDSLGAAINKARESGE
jgi:hypothetical protein